MRLGAPVFYDGDSPDGWITAHKQKGYRAAYCPLDLDSPTGMINDFAAAAAEADILIAEVGAWSNPISPIEAEAESAVKKCVGALRLADAIGANCCVNITGNAGPGAWDGPSPINLTRETFERVVEITRRIIDEAAPERASYCLETMPWMYPNSIESYLELIESIDRRRFGVHFDPVNLINSPEKHYGNGSYIEDAVSRLAGKILSVHAKDQVMGLPLTLTMHEVIPGEGDIDYDTLLRELSKLDPDTPVLIEHLSSEEEYDKAALFIRTKAAELGISL